MATHGWPGEGGAKDINPENVGITECLEEGS